MRKSNSKLSPILRAMDAYERRTTPAEPTCAIAGCDAWPVTRCVCCNRDVCADDVMGAAADDAGLCTDCIFECAGGIACQVVS